MSERVIVENVLSTREFGVLFSGRTVTGSLVRVRCGFPLDGVEAGSSFEVDGDHRSYTDAHGTTWRQIEVSSARRIAVAGALVRPYLGSLPGLGPVRADRLWNVFGHAALTALSDAERIDEVARVIEPERTTIGAAVAARVASAIARDASNLFAIEARQDFYRELEQAGVTDRRAAERLWHLCGDREWRPRLLARPYLVAAHLPWGQADHLGQALIRARGEEPVAHPERLIGAVDSAFQDCFRRGDTAAARTRMLKQVAARDVEAARALDFHRLAGFSLGEDVIRPRGMALLEDLIARDLARRDGVAVVDEAVVAAAESTAAMTLNARQHAAVVYALGRHVTVLSGGAGTGKTATMIVLCAAWESLGGNIELTCVSGKGAMVLSRATRRQASTCASFLSDHGGFRGAEVAPSANARRRCGPRTLLVVDEASMLDTYTLQRLLAALDPRGCLVLVGDPGQLPPVSPGCVFHDLCRDGAMVAELDTVVRQARDSVIPRVASDIRAGRLPLLVAFEGLKPGAFLLDCSAEDAGRLAEGVHDDMLAASTLADCLHLAARNATVAAINSARIERRTPGIPERRLGPFATVALGDPVICRRNRYPDDLRNGQTGVVTALDEDAVEILWDGRSAPSRVSDDLGADVGLAWAMTVHRAQGSSARHVIVRLERTPLVTREWIYTALTRAVETVVFVGPRAALAEGVGRRVERVSGFPASWAVANRR